MKWKSTTGNIAHIPHAESKASDEVAVLFENAIFRIEAFVNNVFRFKKSYALPYNDVFELHLFHSQVQLR